MNKYKYGLLNAAVIFVFSILLFRLYIVSTSDYVDGQDLKGLESSIKTKTVPLYSERGQILDADGNVLAKSISTYNIVVFVNPSRSNNVSTQSHVTDVEATSTGIAQVIGEDSAVIAERINSAIENNLYQTYLGKKASNITANQRLLIEELDLPGVEFEEKKSRTYPYGNFASYQVGYAKYYADENGDRIEGELGVEKSYNDALEGVDGYHTFIADAKGVQIPNTEETVVEPVDGKNVYLTINRDVQLIVESAVRKIDEVYNPEVVLLVIADAKTGKILGVSSTPSFDPNIRDIESYINPLHEQTLEPGSTMKTFTYISAIEEGVYDPNYVYDSSQYVIDDATIKDWNRTGFGNITLHTGYMKSSNVGSSTLGYEFLGQENLESYLEKLGFGDKTGFDLPGEVKGDITIENRVDAVTTTFGQGISITPIQMIQALTVFGTNGDAMRPYIVERIEDENGEVVFKTEPQVNSADIFSEETVSLMKEMMYLYVSGPEALNHSYSYPQYGFIGKTGTAQIAGSDGKYMEGANNYTYSFTGLMPKDDPQVIVYAVVKLPKHGESGSVKDLVTSSIPSIAEIYGVGEDNKENQVKSNTLIMLNLNGLTFDKGIGLLNESYQVETRVLGNGGTIIEQYPKSGETIQTHSIIYVKTDGEITMPDLTGYSYRDAAIVAKMLNLNLSSTGVGHVKAQSIVPGTILSTEKELVVELQ